MRRVAEESRIYEGMFLVRSKPAKEDFDGVMEEITSYIEKADATVLSSGKWDERKLAYNVAGERRGVYVLVHFEGPPESVKPIERACRISENVLRLMVVRDTDGVEIPPPGQGVSGRVLGAEGEGDYRGPPRAAGPAGPVSPASAPPAAKPEEAKPEAAAAPEAPAE